MCCRCSLCTADEKPAVTLGHEIRNKWQNKTSAWHTSFHTSSPTNFPARRWENTFFLSNTSRKISHLESIQAVRAFVSFRRLSHHALCSPRYLWNSGNMFFIHCRCQAGNGQTAPLWFALGSSSMTMHSEGLVSLSGTLSELSLGLLVTGLVLGLEVSDDIDGSHCRRVWKRVNR